MSRLVQTGLVLVCAAFAGCGSGGRVDVAVYPVSGSVSGARGKLPAGVVHFRPADTSAAAGASLSATLTADGSFRTGLPAGHYVAFIDPTPGGDAPVDPALVRLVPKKYRSARESDLRVEVRTAGENRFDLRLR